VVAIPTAPEPSPAPAYESIALSEPPPAARPEPGDDGVPSSLEDAVMREISDRSPDPGGAHVPTSNPPPIVEPSALRKRSSNPPAVDDDWDTVEEPPLASIPPDAVVPAAASATEPEHDTDLEAPYSSPFAVTTEPLAPHPAPAPSLPELPREPEPDPPARTIEPTVPLPRAAPPAVDAPPLPLEEPVLPRRSAWPFIAAFAGLGLAVGVVLQVRGGAAPEATGPTASAPPAPVPPASTAPALPSASPSAATATNASDDLPPGAEVPPGFGLVEVTAPAGSRVRIDGAIGGAGPLASLVAAPGYHEVRVEQDGRDTKQVIEVRAGKTTRIKSAPGP
jgi:hypothetical protein